MSKFCRLSDLSNFLRPEGAGMSDRDREIERDWWYNASREDRALFMRCESLERFLDIIEVGEEGEENE